VSSFLKASSCYLENQQLSNDLIMIRNNREDHGVYVDDLGGAQDQKGLPNQIRSPTHFEFGSQSPRPVHANLHAQKSSRLCFGHSIYVWKSKKTIFTMDLVPCQKIFGIDGNHQNTITSRVDLSVVSPFFGPWAMYLV
jgi:hypothetical protein